jgi:hypothetical protein
VLKVWEAIRKNEASFLQQQCWQEVLDSTAVPGGHMISNRGRITVSSQKLMASLPGLFQSVCSVVCHDRNSSGQRVQLLIMEIRNFREQMLQYRTYVTDQLAGLKVVPLQPAVYLDLAYELLGTSLSALAMANRLLSALGDSEGKFLEKNAILYATEVERLEADMISANGGASFYFSQKAIIAASVHRTVAIWNSEPGKIIETWRFNSWCKAMQKETCNCICV